MGLWKSKYPTHSNLPSHAKVPVILTLGLRVVTPVTVRFPCNRRVGTGNAELRQCLDRYLGTGNRDAIRIESDLWPHAKKTIRNDDSGRGDVDGGGCGASQRSDRFNLHAAGRKSQQRTGRHIGKGSRERGTVRSEIDSRRQEVAWLTRASKSSRHWPSSRTRHRCPRSVAPSPLSHLPFDLFRIGKTIREEIFGFLELLEQ